MVCKTYSAVLHGMEAVIVQVETDARNGIPQMQLVGALASEAKAAKDRVRVAVENSGFRLPPKHVTINLSPADIRKEGTSFDLAVAISILAAFGFIPEEKTEGCMFVGELSLDGKLNAVPGILPIARQAGKEDFHTLVVPEGNALEAALQDNVKVYGVKNLYEVAGFLSNAIKLTPVQPVDYEKMLDYSADEITFGPDYADIIGQTAAKRALMIAAAGGHHLLMIGPPGSGKTALAERMPSILPRMTQEEMLDISEVYSVTGNLTQHQKLICKRPFQAPHHATTITALIGGGRNARPGLISLCHHGVLFLDEFTEFKTEVLETLRQPLEGKKVSVARLNATYIYPAAFQLIAAMNPCPCGYYPDRNKCRCQQNQINRYIGKISQPILDRMDMMIEIFPVRFEAIVANDSGISSREIREKVSFARRRQEERFAGKDFFVNSDMGKKEIEEFCILSKDAKKMMKQLFENTEFSTRRYFRILRLARTIADLDDEDVIQKRHLAEAFGYSNIGKKYWGTQDETQ